MDFASCLRCELNQFTLLTKLHAIGLKSSAHGVDQSIGSQVRIVFIQPRTGDFRFKGRFQCNRVLRGKQLSRFVEKFGKLVCRVLGVFLERSFVQVGKHQSLGLPLAINLVFVHGVSYSRIDETSSA